MIGDPNKCLISLLAALETCFKDPEHGVVREAISVYGETEATNGHFRFQDALQQTKEGLPQKIAQKICKKLVAILFKGGFDEFFHVLEDFRGYIQKAIPEPGHKTMDPHTRHMLLVGFDKAFNYRYTEGQAKVAFLNYLDIQGASMATLSLGKTTRQSYCGTIVQSSCTGKSRLVQE